MIYLPQLLNINNLNMLCIKINIIRYYSFFCKKHHLQDSFKDGDTSVAYKKNELPIFSSCNFSIFKLHNLRKYALLLLKHVLKVIA